MGVCVCKIVAGSSFCLIVVVSAAAAAAAVFEALGVGVQFSRRRRRDRLCFSTLESHLAALRALQAGDSDSHSYAEFLVFSVKIKSTKPISAVRAKLITLYLR